jgi:ankyrin repeat protein
MVLSYFDKYNHTSSIFPELIDKINELNTAPLQYSAQEAMLHAVQSLVPEVANVNKINNQDDTPLYLAAENGYRNIVETLFKVNVYVLMLKRIKELHSCITQRRMAMRKL